MNNLIIIGASYHGAVIEDIAINQSFSVIFWDDDPSKNNQDFKVEKRALEIPNNSSLIIGIGSNHVRELISMQYPIPCFISLFHQKSIISEKARIGIGSVVMAGAIINNNSTIGLHCIINTGVVIDHDCIIEDFVHISPNATLCGNVTIGKGTWVGAGATIINGINIGSNVIIGAGAVIINDIPNNRTVVGNPGRIIKFK